MQLMPESPASATATSRNIFTGPRFWYMVFAELNYKPGKMTILSSLIIAFERYSCGRNILW